MIIVRLRESDLVSAGACSEGIALFRSIIGQPEEGEAVWKGETVWEGEWTRIHALWFAVAYPSFSNWMCGQGLIPIPSLSRADLFDANLSRADLSDANLSYANLFGADLSYADLSGAYLSYADLSGANLFDANLSGADLSGADLSGANLSYADLSGAYLSRANLSRADLGEWERGPDGYARRKAL